MRRDREPHIGEYDTKTNAICDFPLIPMASGSCEIGPAMAPLLPVAHQHLIASLGQLGAILLQAGQDDEVALIDHRAAETLNVARTGFLLLRRAAALLLLGDRSGGNRERQQDECREKSIH